MREMIILSAGCLMLASVPATAAPVPFCKGYANEAAADYFKMRKTVGCVRPPNNRWHPDRQLHFSWCVGAPSGAVNAERIARNNTLADCNQELGN